MEFLDSPGLRGGEVLLLVRIFGEVEEFEFLRPCRIEVLDQFPVVFPDGPARDAAQEVGFVERIMPVDGLSLGRRFGVAPCGEGGNPVQLLGRIGLDSGGFQKGGVEIVIDHGLVAGLACRDFSVRPAQNQGDPYSAFVKLAFAAPQGSVGGNVRFPSVVAGENEDGVLGQAQFVQFAGQQADAVIDAFKHGGQVGVVAWSPMGTGPPPSIRRPGKGSNSSLSLRAGGCFLRYLSTSSGRPLRMVCGA